MDCVCTCFGHVDFHYWRGHSSLTPFHLSYLFFNGICLGDIDSIQNTFLFGEVSHEVLGQIDRASVSSHYWQLRHCVFWQRRCLNRLVTLTRRIVCGSYSHHDTRDHESYTAQDSCYFSHSLILLDKFITEFSFQPYEFYFNVVVPSV